MSLGFIKHNIKTKHPGVPEAAYKTIVRPQLEYASQYGAHTESRKWFKEEPSTGL